MDGSERGGWRPPADLVAAVLATVLAVVALLFPVVRGTPARLVFGVPFLLFVPGYALVAALYPEADTASASASGRTLSGLERVTLSVVFSLAAVSTVGLVLNYTPFGIRLAPMLAVLGFLVLTAVAVADRRRRRLPPDQRLRVPWRRSGERVRAELLKPASATEAVANLLLVAAVLFAVTSIGFAVTAPTEGESLTEFYLVSGDGSPVGTGAGSLAADDSARLGVEVRNREHRPVNYTVVVQRQRMVVEGGSVRAVGTERVGSYAERVSHDGIWRTFPDVDPQSGSGQVRLQYLLYRGAAPADPSPSSAYRELHVWVNRTGT